MGIGGERNGREGSGRGGRGVQYCESIEQFEDQRINLKRSRQQGLSTLYSPAIRVKVVCNGIINSDIGYDRSKVHLEQLMWVMPKLSVPIGFRVTKLLRLARILT